MRINKSATILVLIIFVGTALFGARDANYYKKMYRLAVDMKEKRDKVKEINSVADESYKDLILEILDEQINHGRERNASIRRDFEEWIYYSTLTAGKIRIPEAAIKLKTLYPYIDNPIYKGTIALSMGMTKNKEILPWLNELLKDLNDKHRKGEMKGNEEIVFGTISALSEFNDPSSFRDVFYAAMPNYSEKIRTLGENLLLSITKDPASLAPAVINKENDFVLVNQMMDFVYNSESSSDGKIDTILLAIERVLGTTGERDEKNKELKTKIKNNGVKYLGELKAQKAGVVDMIQKKWDDDTLVKTMKTEDVLFQITNIEALQKIGTLEACKAITGRLKYYNDKIKDGSLTGYGHKDGAKIVSALIRALGSFAALNDEAAFYELELVRTSKEYGDILRKEAAAAVAGYKQ